MANKLPQTAGTTVNASQNEVYMFQDADVNSNKLRKIGSGVVTFSKGDEIGQFTGNKNGSFYEITYTYKYNILPFVKRTVSITGWFLGLQITTETRQEILEKEILAAEKEAQLKDDELEKYLADITGDTNIKKELTGSGTREDSGNPATSTTNIVLGFAIITAIGLIIAGFIKKIQKQKSKTMPILATILATIGSLAKPISDIFVAKENTKLSKISIEQLEEQVKLSEAEQDTQKIALASKALELKQEETKQETNQQFLQWLVIASGLGLLGFIAWLIFGKSDKPKAGPRSNP